MKANDFVKKVGWDLAKEYADECPSYCNYLHEHGFYSISETWQLNEKHVLVSDLKRLVESHELVESCGGLESAKKELQRQSILRWINPETERLRGAIKRIAAAKNQDDINAEYLDPTSEYLSDQDKQRLDLAAQKRESELFGQ